MDTSLTIMVIFDMLIIFFMLIKEEMIKVIDKMTLITTRTIAKINNMFNGLLEMVTLSFTNKLITGIYTKTMDRYISDVNVINKILFSFIRLI